MLLFTVWALGCNSNGQLGVGDQNARSGVVPLEGFASIRVRSVRAAENYSMAVTGMKTTCKICCLLSHIPLYVV